MTDIMTKSSIKSIMNSRKLERANQLAMMASNERRRALLTPPQSEESINENIEEREIEMPKAPLVKPMEDPVNMDDIPELEI